MHETWFLWLDTVTINILWQMKLECDFWSVNWRSEILVLQFYYRILPALPCSICWIPHPDVSDLVLQMLSCALSAEVQLKNLWAFAFCLLSSKVPTVGLRSWIRADLFLKRSAVYFVEINKKVQAWQFSPKLLGPASHLRCKGIF